MKGKFLILEMAMIISKKTLIKERGVRNDEEKRNEELTQIINDRERRIQILNDECERGKRIRQ